MLQLAASLFGVAWLVLGQQTIDLSNRLEMLLNQPTPASQPALNYEVVIIRALPTPTPPPTRPPTAAPTPAPTPTSPASPTTPPSPPPTAPPSATQPAPEESAAEKKLSALIAALKTDLAKTLAAYPDMTAFDASSEKEGSAGRLDYFHHCKYEGKRGYEDLAPDAVAVLFQVAKPEILKQAEHQAPHHVWKNLGLIGWNYRHYGAEVPADLVAKLDSLLDSYLAKLDELDQSAPAPESQPAKTEN